uniref:Uncharacterized protein n=1 Tax=Arundo donax TaxID=35708 RepID=A0A0A9FUK4_ARUDO
MESCLDSPCQFQQKQCQLGGHHPSPLEPDQEMLLLSFDVPVGVPLQHGHIFLLKLGMHGTTPQVRP